MKQTEWLDGVLRLAEEYGNACYLRSEIGAAHAALRAHLAAHPEPNQREAEQQRRRDEENSAGKNAMQALAEAKRAESMPSELIEDLEQAASGLIAGMAVSRASLPNVHPPALAGEQDNPGGEAVLPSGYVLVPVEPTRGMIAAGFEVDPDGSQWLQRPAETYRAMLAAAPAPATRQQTDSGDWPDQRNRGLLQAAKQALSALDRHARLPWGQPGYPTPNPGWALLGEARAHLKPAIEREEAFRSAVSDSVNSPALSGKQDNRGADAVERSEIEAFEAWMKTKGYRVNWRAARPGIFAGYDSTPTHHAWEGWYARATTAAPADRKRGIDERIADAETKLATWTQADRDSVRCQGLDEFRERMRLDATTATPARVASTSGELKQDDHIADAGNMVQSAILYEHEDGRYAVAASAELAEFAKGDPRWHRVGPVDVAGSPDSRSAQTQGDGNE